jgi:hypothetical protein
MATAVLFVMPLVPFESLPDTARVWVFASDKPVTGARSHQLLAAVDQYLSQWQAHGHPLTCGRDWRDDRFLAIGVDQTDAYASGCSIDGMFRALQALQGQLGATLVNGSLVHFRDRQGAIRSATRDEFLSLAHDGNVTGDTAVFDPTVTTAGEWRQRFETVVGRSWHRGLVTSR